MRKTTRIWLPYRETKAGREAAVALGRSKAGGSTGKGEQKSSEFHSVGVIGFLATTRVRPCFVLMKGFDISDFVHDVDDVR